jgi:hypothetical protein
MNKISGRKPVIIEYEQTREDVMSTTLILCAISYAVKIGTGD